MFSRLARVLGIKDPEPPKPARPPCPFYGFVASHRLMLDSYGNTCALTYSHRPCAMEAEGQQPDWDRCTGWNHEGNTEMLSKFLAGVTAFPEELHPKGGRAWSGISAQEWFHRVMGRSFQ